MPRSHLAKGRILASRVFVGLVIALALLSESIWEQKNPAVATSLFVVGVCLVSVATVGRLWCSLYVAGRKTKSLVVEGPYSLCRHPLYFFSLIGALGVGFACERFIIAVLLAAGFALYYPWVIRHEERKMHSRHEAEYEAYCRTVPQFLPRLSQWREPREYVVDPVVFRRHMFSVLWFVWLVGLAELVEELHALGAFPVLWKLY